MSTFCTKYRKQQDRKVANVDAELPTRHSKQTSELHSVVLGVGDDYDRFETLKRTDYGVKVRNKDMELKDREFQKVRIADMKTKHFCFGHAPSTMQSEVRGTLLPPTKEVLTQRIVRPIGGPNNKGASNIYISSEDHEQWKGDMTSSHRHDYRFSKPTGDSNAEADNHIKQMRASHFAIGNDKDEWVSTSQIDYKSPPATVCVHTTCPSTFSSVPLSSQNEKAPGFGFETASGSYGRTLHNHVHKKPPPAAVDLRKSNMVFGYDPTNFESESKGVFRESKYVQPTVTQKRPGFVAK